MSGSTAGESGQAGVELLAGVPLALLVVLAAAQLLAAGACREYAAHAANAGAVALLQDSSPARAARAAVPAWSSASVRVTGGGRRVVVRVRPRATLPGLADLLEAESSADAGPAT